jgi:cytoskeletal protein RodZ
VEQIVTQLIEARHKAGLSLEDLHKLTMIPIRQLEFLESYQFDEIGPSVYVKGFIRRYAQEVGIDPDSLWQLEASLLPLASPARPRHSRQPLRNYLIPILRILAILVILFLAGVLIYKAISSYLDPGPPSPPAPPGQQQEDPSPQPEPEPEPQPEPEPEVTIEPVQEDNSEAIYLVHNAKSLEITLAFSGKCWTRMTVDGEKAGERTFTTGQQHQLTAAGTVRIRFGAPINVSVAVNGVAVEIPDIRKGFNLEIRLAPAE